jgi:hypothetical protein
MMRLAAADHPEAALAADSAKGTRRRRSIQHILKLVRALTDDQRVADAHLAHPAERDLLRIGHLVTVRSGSM